MRADWELRMNVEGLPIDVHTLRMTHRTWSEAMGVPPALIDKQLGHAGAQAQRALEVHRRLAGSLTGRKHYLDLNSALVDASRSAAAVRELLDTAERGLRARGTPILFPKEPELGARASSA